MPDWIVKLARRLLALPEGHCYQILLVKDSGGITWSVINTSKIEKP